MSASAEYDPYAPDNLPPQPATEMVGSEAMPTMLLPVIGPESSYQAPDAKPAELFIGTPERLEPAESLTHAMGSVLHRLNPQPALLEDEQGRVVGEHHTAYVQLGSIPAYESGAVQAGGFDATHEVELALTYEADESGRIMRDGPRHYSLLEHTEHSRLLSWKTDPAGQLLGKVVEYVDFDDEHGVGEGGLPDDRRIENIASQIITSRESKGHTIDTQELGGAVLRIVEDDVSYGRHHARPEDGQHDSWYIRRTDDHGNGQAA